jgi:hypothetical protein
VIATAPQPDSAAQSVVYATAARIMPPGDERLTDADLLALVRRAAIDPAILDERPPFFFTAEISNSRVDAYSTVMEASTLRNFATEAAAGVSLQNSHNTRELGFGRSVSGRVIGGQGNSISRVEADFLMLSGLNLNGVDTDHVRDAIRARLIADMSVGFTGGETRCSICGRDMGGWGWLFGDDDACPHFSGETYDLVDKKTGKKTGEKSVAIGHIENAHLVEVSLVYEGATPNAGIIKAQRAAEAGKLPPATARRLEDRYRIRLPGVRPNWAGHRETQQEAPMADTETPATEPETTPEPEPAAETPPAAPVEPDGTRTVIAAARQALVDAGQAADTELVAGIRQLAQENARLRPLADDGRTYRTDLIAEALAEGVRAQGEGFAADTYRSLLETAPLATVKRFRDDWRVLGDKVFQGGRQTKDTHEPRPAVAPPRAIPDAAFAA